MNQELAKQSTEKLKGMVTMVTTITICLGVMLAVLLGMALFSHGKKNTALTVVPLALMPILFVNLNNIKNIKAELKSRQNAASEPVKES